MFNALVVRKNDEGKTSAAVEQLAVDDLPHAEVLVAVDYSTVNYKDGLCIGPGGGLVRKYPHVPGIDFAGTVEASDDPRYKAGDKVVLTGWRVGEAHWGGYAQKVRVNADWLVPLPEGLDARQAMAVGTAGFTAMLAVMALEDHGLKPGHGPVLVTGAAGGVGSVATAILANLGYEVAAVTGRPEAADYLRSLGATQIVAREEINETTKRPLEAEGQGVDVRMYKVIYELIDDVRSAMVGLLPPTVTEEFQGRAEVRETFTVPKIGTIAGCYITEGKITRSDLCRLVRDGVQVYEGKLGSLKRFKDDARDVASGFECGIGIDGYNDIKIGDVIETYKLSEKPPTLE